MFDFLISILSQIQKNDSNQFAVFNYKFYLMYNAVLKCPTTINYDNLKSDDLYKKIWNLNIEYLSNCIFFSNKYDYYSKSACIQFTLVIGKLLFYLFFIFIPIILVKKINLKTELEKFLDFIFFNVYDKKYEIILKKDSKTDISLI